MVNVATPPSPSTTFSDLVSISPKAPVLARPRLRRSPVVLGRSDDRKLAQPATGPLAHRIIRLAAPKNGRPRVPQCIRTMSVWVGHRAVGPSHHPRRQTEDGSLPSGLGCACVLTGPVGPPAPKAADWGQIRPTRSGTTSFGMDPFACHRQAILDQERRLVVSSVRELP
jgi:hypothetical protein